MGELRYNLHEDGRVSIVGYLPELENIVINEPFDISTAQYYQLISNEWVDLRTYYKYIIMPCEFIDYLYDMVYLVEDVIPPQFCMLLGATSINTRAGTDLKYVDIGADIYIHDCNNLIY